MPVQQGDTPGPGRSVATDQPAGQLAQAEPGQGHTTTGPGSAACGLQSNQVSLG